LHLVEMNSEGMSIKRSVITRKVILRPCRIFKDTVIYAIAALQLDFSKTLSYGH